MELVECYRTILAVQLSSNRDKWSWNMGPIQEYSVKEARAWLKGPVGSKIEQRFYWCKWLPNKVNLFMWRANIDGIPTMIALRRRNMTIGDGLCVLCGDADETTDHVFTACSLACGVWCGITSWCKVPPVFWFSISDIQKWLDQDIIGEKKKDIVYGLFVLTCWRLWKARNDKIFRQVDVNVAQIVSDIKALGFLWFTNRSKVGSVSWRSWCNFNVDMM
ncbi:putative reverse transcriptase zinc-binding domain-containing protein [Helianthus annuus]|uniref:uncharacterized protein LOC110928408 n=1 Tax=Helianthus annuus TaxID=4232 RepID=UPI000B8F1E65|nr:uncharacterized protein LOC110928408 [Helianthus annuus]KAJ0495650.1 putative reverse transcriptase zinc-binding domain-containing protein [Helianthus annuus]